MAFLLNSSELTGETEVSLGSRPPRAPGENAAAAHVASGTAPFWDSLSQAHVPEGPPSGAVPLALDAEGFDIYACTDLDAVAGIWTSFQETAHLTPFQRFEWLKHWIDTCNGPAIEPYIVLVYDAGRLRLIAPLAVESGLFTRRLVWLGQSINDQNAPIVDPSWLAELDEDRAARLWRHVTRHTGEVDYLHLIRNPDVLAACRNPFLGDDPQAYPSDSHHLNLLADWHTFYGKLRGSKSRRRLREKANRLAKAGRVRLRRVRGAKELAATIAMLLAWKAEQLDGRGSRNPFSDGRIQKLLNHIAAHQPDSGVMRVYVLEVGGRTVAATVALTHGGVFNFFIPAFDDTGIRNCSPGTIMLVKLIELSARAGYSKFDFSLGDESYKAEWCDTRVEMTHQTEALNLRGAVMSLALRTVLRLKRTIKSNDRLFAFLEAANARRTALIRRFTDASGATPKLLSNGEQNG